MQSLREKLLKAGLVTAEQAQKVEAEKPRPLVSPSTNQPRSARNVPPPRREREREPEREAPIPKLPPLPGSKEHQRIAARKQRELDAGLYELVRSGEVPLQQGPATFYFVTRRGKLRRLQLSAEQAQALEGGTLAVVERQEPDRVDHSLVAPEVAEQMFALFPKAVRFLNRPGSQVGFLTEEELATKKAEAAANPAGNDAPDAPEPAAEEKPAEEKPAGVFIAVKRAT